MLVGRDDTVADDGQRERLHEMTSRGGEQIVSSFTCNESKTITE